MADKTSQGYSHEAATASNEVTTSGAVVATTVTITWDDADNKLTIMDAFERAKNGMLTYLATR